MPICCGKYELWPSMLWKKVGKGQRTVYCANSQFGGLHKDRGRYRKGMLNFCGRPLQCLSCGKI